MATCLLCELDAKEMPEDDRRLAYFIIGQATDPEDAEQEVGMCSLHVVTMIPALAAVGEVCGHEGHAKRIRAIGNVRLVPPPKSGP